MGAGVPRRGRAGKAVCAGFGSRRDRMGPSFGDIEGGHAMDDFAGTAPRAEGAYHYGVMRRAIELIDARAGEHPSLEALAAELGLSPAHFQRVFSAWAGVSPKRLQQYLALGHAKALLRERATVLDAAASAGLTGTGRLHDLFLRWEAMSPGDYAKGGVGLEIRHGWADSPFGEMLVMATDRGICGLAFAAETGREAALADMTTRWPGARHVAGEVGDLARGLFDRGAEARLHLIGAPFQIKVWEALMSIPSGQVTTYGDIAAHIGHPKAVRAVGTAVGRNPVSWLIPCHRALRKSGGLGGYHWGLPVKRAMLAWEAGRAEAS
jgi:AraC family transcriptional regulator of adaptative response/methylated-DNA-[protein]-cysteine methyltransferase